MPNALRADSSRGLYFFVKHLNVVPSHMIFSLKLLYNTLLPPFFSVSVAMVLLKNIPPAPNGFRPRACFLYICNNVFDTGAALKDLCISHLLLNGQIKHNKR